MRTPAPSIRAALLAALAAGTLLTAESIAYVAHGATWAAAEVPYYINTANLDLPGSAVEAAVRVGADAWHQQGGVSFRFRYAGSSAQSTNTYDGTNLVTFRNASSGSAIATTYWWTSGGRIVDADIVFWDGGFRFFSGASGCSSGFYIEDIAAHEFGHALGLAHSDAAAATMYFAVASCSTSSRSLDSDDIAGVRFLYPASAGGPPTAPTGLRVVSD
jgi:hypothetical protein